MTRAVLAICMIAFLTSSAHAQWEAVNSFPEAGARIDAAGLSHGGRLYAIGGLPHATGPDQTPVHYLEPNAPDWKSGRPAEGAIVRQGVGVDDLGRIIVFGGVDGQDPEGDPGATFQYDIVEGQWTGLADRSESAPQDRFAWATDDQARVYSFGGGPGAAADSGNRNSSYVERYLGTSDTWEPVAPLPIAVADASAVNDGRGNLLVFGGLDATASSRLASVQSYDVGTGTWSTSLPDMPVALSGHRAVLGVDGRVYVLGGVSGPVGSGVTEAAVHVLHLDTLTWSSGIPMQTPRSHFAAALWDDDHIYAMGGSNDSGGTNTVEKLFTPTCPIITEQPVPMAAWRDSAAGFSVAAAGTAPFGYQWYREGVPLADGPTAGGSVISGATTAALLISGPRESDAGGYTVSLSNACGATISARAELTIRVPPAIPDQWQVHQPHPGWATLGSAARGISNGLIGGSGTMPTVLPDGRTFNLAHPVVWDTANLVPVDITPAGSVGGAIYDVEGDLLVGWYWHTWQCWGGTQYWTCAWQSAAHWTAPNFVFTEALHSSGPEYDSLYGTDGVSMVGTLTYEYSEGNYDSKAHLWLTPNAQLSLHNSIASDSGASAVDGAYQFGWSRGSFAGNHATMWQGTRDSQTDIHPTGYGSSSISGAGGGQAVGAADNRAGLWIGAAGVFIDLHPTGPSAFSAALAAHDGIQCGQVQNQAALWAGTPWSYVDLGGLLPPDFSSSTAEDFEVQPDGSMIVVGHAFNTTTGRSEALVWRSVGGGIPGDLNGDGHVDLTDLAIALSDFGCTAPPATDCPGDADGDEDTDLSDLAVVLANFGI